MKKFSICERVYLNKPYAKVTLEDVHSLITGGELVLVTESLRKLREKDEREYKEKRKQSLKNCSFGGVFFPVRANANLVEASQYLTIDVDHISTELGEDLKILRERVLQDKEIGLRLLFVSPSGDGFKAICETSKPISSQEDYSGVCGSLIHYFEDVLGIRVDATKDVSRGCYLCHDSDAYLNMDESLSLFDPDKYPVPEAPKVDYTPLREKLNLTEEIDVIEEIVRRIESQRVDLTIDRNDWLTCAIGLSSLGERGRDFLQRISSFFPKYTPEETDGLFNYVSKKYKGNLGQFINVAKKYGVDVSVKRNKDEYRAVNYRDNMSIKEDVKEPLEASKITTEERLSKYLETPTKESLGILSQKKKEGLPTPYELKDREGKKEKIVLPSGAITLVCGKTSHGKSKLLQNLALYTAEGAEEGETVLYFTYEESSLDVTIQFANMALGIRELSYYDKNETQINRYFQTGEHSHIPQGEQGRFQEYISNFESLIFSGKLRVLSPDSSSSKDLVEIIDYIASKMSVKAVFIDYVQLLTNGKNGRKDKTSDLADVANDLIEASKRLGVPFVLACQSNKSAQSPEDISADNVADAYDLARAANLLLCIWNSNFSKVKEYDENNEHRCRLEAEGFKLGEGGKLYIKASKNRGGTPHIDGVFDFIGETGQILTNGDLPIGETLEEETPKKNKSIYKNL